MSTTKVPRRTTPRLGAIIVSLIAIVVGVTNFLAVAYVFAFPQPETNLPGVVLIGVTSVTAFSTAILSLKQSRSARWCLLLWLLVTACGLVISAFADDLPHDWVGPLGVLVLILLGSLGFQALTVDSGASKQDSEALK